MKKKPVYNDHDLGFTAKKDECIVCGKIRNGVVKEGKDKQYVKAKPEDSCQCGKNKPSFPKVPLDDVIVNPVETPSLRQTAEGFAMNVGEFLEVRWRLDPRMPIDKSGWYVKQDIVFHKDLILNEAQSAAKVLPYELLAMLSQAQELLNKAKPPAGFIAREFHTRGLTAQYQNGYDSGVQKGISREQMRILSFFDAICANKVLWNHAVQQEFRDLITNNTQTSDNGRGGKK